jgi:hypothetical protein
VFLVLNKHFIIVSAEKYVERSICDVSYLQLYLLDMCDVVLIEVFAPSFLLRDQINVT